VGWGPSDGLIPHPRSPCKKNYETEEEVRAQQRAVEPLMNQRRKMNKNNLYSSILK
jgi:hypothetical protein